MFRSQTDASGVQLWAARDLHVADPYNGVQQHLSAQAAHRYQVAEALRQRRAARRAQRAALAPAPRQARPLPVS